MKNFISPNEPKEVYDALVIGGGFAGIFTAIELCEKNRQYKILLVEAGEELLGRESSSYNECYKLHTGIHYTADKKTAIQCLKDSVNFAKEFGQFILGANAPNLPWRHGRHYLMSNSIVDETQVKEVCEALKQTYIDLIEEDPRNKVFGEPNDFFRYLDPSEYSFVAKSISCDIKNPNGQGDKSKPARVILGIETPESQIDLNRLKDYLASKLASYDNLTLLTQHQVKNLQFSSGSLNYESTILDKSTGHEHQIISKGIVNCSWKNIEELDHQIGYYIPDDRIIRIKVSLLVSLPKELTQINTCIFFSGPHCSVTNLGNGQAIVTYEPETNVGYYHPLENISFSKLNITNAKLAVTEKLGKDLSDAILAGAARYIPALSQATVLEVRVGHVKIIMQPNETYSIYDKDSSIHKRREDGIEQRGLCYISNSGMKMTYTAASGKLVAEILEWNFMFRRALERLVKEIKSMLKKELGVDFLQKLPIQILLNNLLRDYLTNQITISPNTLDKLLDEDNAKKITGHILQGVLTKADIISELRSHSFFHPSKDCCPDKPQLTVDDPNDPLPPSLFY